jgi:MSHA pilin protein MshD
MEAPAMSIKQPGRMRGVTLVELIIAMAIVGVALAGMVAAYNRANVASADPLVTQQMLAVAETMMEEIMQKPYTGDGAVPARRVLYDEIRDYAGYAQTGISNVNGDAVAGLERYGVAVSVHCPGNGAAATASCPAGSGGPALTGINVGDALRIVVTVSAPGADALTLTGWRTRP